MKPILLIGEALGKNEDRAKVGFVGPSGIELLKMLNEAEVIELTETDRSYLHRYYNSGDPNQIDMIWNLHPEIIRTNVFNLHPHGDNLKNLCGEKSQALAGWPKLGTMGWIRAEFGPELERLGDEILTIDPNLIICLGNTPLWALSGHTGVSKLRGTTFLSDHCVAGYKCLIAYHPAAVIRQWELRPVTIIDLSKAVEENSHAEVTRPECHIWIEPNLEDLERFYNEHILGCKILSVDIETSGNQITCIGFAPRKEIALVVPIHDDRAKGRNYWKSAEDERQCWSFIRRILEDKSIPKLFQNGAYDLAFIWRTVGIATMGASEDTMLLHHALLPESLKGLGFLGSVYTSHGPWKTERKSNETIKRDE